MKLRSGSSSPKSNTYLYTNWHLGVLQCRGYRGRIITNLGYKIFIHWEKCSHQNEFTNQTQERWRFEPASSCIENSAAMDSTKKKSRIKQPESTEVEKEVTRSNGPFHIFLENTKENRKPTLYLCSRCKSGLSMTETCIARALMAQTMHGNTKVWTFDSRELTSFEVFKCWFSIHILTKKSKFHNFKQVKLWNQV